MPEAPEGFFESFEKEMDEVIDAKVASEAKVVSGSSLAIRWTAIAASVSVLLLAFFMVGRLDEQHQSTEDLLASVSNEDIVLYLDHSGLELDMILEQVEPEYWEENQAIPQLEEMSDQELNLILEEYEDVF